MLAAIVVRMLLEVPTRHMTTCEEWSDITAIQEYEVVVVIDQFLLIDYLLLVSKYLIYEVIKPFVQNNSLYFDHYYLHKENVHDQIFYDIQLSKISIQMFFSNHFYFNILHLK